MTDSRVIPRPEKQLEQRLATVSRDLRRLKAGGLSSAAYRPYVPTLTNVTLGAGGVLRGSYRYRIPRECHFKMKFTLGTGSDITGNITIDLPLEAAENDQGPITAYAYNPATGVIPMQAFMFSTTQVRIDAILTSGTYALAQGTSATIPFDWNAVPDANFSMSVVYETLE